MSTEIVLALLLLPLAAAVLVWVLGPKRGDAVRTVSALTSVVMLLLALVLMGNYLELDRPPPAERPTFAPAFVPGSSAGDPHRTSWNILTVGGSHIQFYLGVDGLNIWLILLT